MDKQDKIEEEESIMKTPEKKQVDNRTINVEIAQEDSTSKSNENVSSNTNNQTETKTVVNEATNSNPEQVQNDAKNQNDDLVVNLFEDNEINLNDVQSVKSMLLNLQKLVIIAFF